MDQYMEHMKSLRSQMNEIEEGAARRSVDEQKQKTQIETLEKDLNLVKSEERRLNEEAEEIMKAKISVALQVDEKRRRIFALEAESHTLSQTLELLQQEMANKIVKFEEKRLYYTKVSEELNHKLQEQKDWLELYQQKIGSCAEMDVDEGLNSHKFEEATEKPAVVGETEGISKSVPLVNTNFEKMHDEDTTRRHNELMSQLNNGESKLHDLLEKKSVLAEDNKKSKHLLEQINLQIESTPPALSELDVNILEEEHKALVNDKAGELEYLQSLKDQINQLKGISQVIKCKCGKEYSVELSS